MQEGGGGGRGTDADIKARLGKGGHALNTRKPLWRSTIFSARNKLRIFHSNVKAVPLYGSKTWPVNSTLSHQLHVFTNSCRLKVRWPEGSTSRPVITDQPISYHTRNCQKKAEVDRTHTKKPPTTTKKKKQQTNKKPRPRIGTGKERGGSDDQI